MLITIFGKRGSGKTTAIRKMIDTFKKPIIIADVLGNFDPTLEEIQGKKNPNNENWAFCDNIPDAISELEEYLKEPDEHSGVIVIQHGDMSKVVDFMSAALWESGGGTLVLDEADAIRIAEAPCFDKAIKYGRNKGIDIITGCRRPAELDKDITAGADAIYIFKTHEPRDIDYFSKKIGHEYAAQLNTLQKYHGVYIDYLEEKTGTFKTDKKGAVIKLTEKEVQ